MSEHVHVNVEGVVGTVLALCFVLLSLALWRATAGVAETRALALVVFCMGLFHLSFGGVRPMLDDPVLAYATFTASRLAAVFYITGYVLLLGTLRTPLSAWIRTWWGMTVVAGTFVVPIAHLLLLPELWTITMAPWQTLPGWQSIVGPAAVYYQLGLTIPVLIYGAVVAVDALRRASGTRRRTMQFYVAAFVTSDLLIAIQLLIQRLGPVALYEAINFAMIQLAGTLFVVILSYGVLRAHIYDIDLKIKWTISRGTLAGAFVAVFFVVGIAAQEFLVDQYGYIVGAVAAGALLFFLAPLQRFGQRIADAALPGVRNDEQYIRLRKEEVYRAAVEGAMADGVITDAERSMLAALQDSLGLSAAQALRWERRMVGP